MAAHQHGTLVTDARLCFYAANRLDPYSFYFPSTVTCQPASTPARLAPGEWLFFVSAGESAVSAWPGHLVVGSSEQSKSVPWELVDGSVINVAGHTAVEDRLSIYFPATRTRPPLAVPAIGTARKVVVPRGIEGYPVFHRDGKPVLLGEPFVATLPRHDIQVRKSRSVMIPLEVGRPAWQTLLSPDHDLADPKVDISDGSQRFSSTTGWNLFLPPLVIVRGLSTTAKAVDVRAGGGSWTEFAGRITLDPDAEVTAAKSPITISLRPPIEIAVSVAPIPSAIGAGCAAGADEVPRLAVLRCTNLQPGVPAELQQTSQCIEVANAELDVSVGVQRYALDGAEPGEYLALVRGPSIGTLGTTFRHDESAPSLQNISRTLITLTGTVTRGRQPVGADLRFGASARASTRPDTGYFEVGLTGASNLTPVTVTTCDGAQYDVYPNEPIDASKPLRIELEAPSIRVSVRDRTSSAPIAAQVDVLNAEPVFVVTHRNTSEDGRATIDNLVMGGDVKVCASAKGYRSECSETFSLASVRERDVVVELSPSRSRSGVVRSSVPLKAGRLCWVDPSRGPTECVALHADGSFAYEREHRTETIVVVSANRPLFVGSGSERGNVLVVTLPDTPATSIRITGPPSGVAPAGTTDIAIVVGGVIIPSAALTVHQGFRGEQMAVPDGGLLAVRDLPAGVPVTVLFGYRTGEWPANVPAGAEIFYLPEHRAHFGAVPVDSAGEARYPTR